MSEPDWLTAYLYAAELAKTDIKKLKDEKARLKADIERLIEAGDAMAENCEAMTSSEYDSYDSDLMKFVKAWNAAKGVQS